MKTLEGVSYNLDNFRDDNIVRGEVGVLMKDADFLCYQEGAEYVDNLDRLKGSRVFTSRNRGGSGKDAGIIVDNDVPAWGYKLARTRVKWKKEKAPGMHWPRSFPSVVIEGVRVVSVHFPRQIHTAAYVACWIALLVLALRERRPLVLVGDWNKSASRKGKFTPRSLAKIARLKTASAGGIDFALFRGCDIPNMRHVPFGYSDHDPIRFTVIKD